MKPLSHLLGMFQSTSRRENAPGRELEGKFNGLSPMQGKSKEEILAVVGPPTSVSAGTGYELLDWSTKSYHIGIKFDPKTNTVMSTTDDATSRPGKA